MEKETAMKILKELHDNSLFSNRIALETIIPELADGNDERIRKDIIAYIRKANGEPYNVLPSGSYCVLEMITWLEKQGEQKPTEVRTTGYWNVKDIEQKPFDYERATITQKDFAPKQESKFKVGDYIVSDYCMGRVVELTNDAYLLDAGQGIPFSCPNTRLWDVTKDAKDGDILVSRFSKPFIYNGKCNNYTVGAYCGVDNVGIGLFGGGKGSGWTNIEGVTPATKEQQELLFQKMKEAGYTFDFDKKKLKKIEGEIEIPFGAKDSELQEVTYYIPKGFHAEIDDDKVAIKKGEKSTEREKTKLKAMTEEQREHISLVILGDVTTMRCDESVIYIDDFISYGQMAEIVDYLRKEEQQ